VPKAVPTGAKVSGTPNPFESIREMARAKARFCPVMIFFYHSDKKSYLAKGCHKMNTTVFCDTEVVKASKKFLCLAVDFRTLHKTLQIQFKVKIVPTILFTDAFSSVLYTLRGSHYPAKSFHKFMGKARKRNEKAVNAYKAKMEALQKKFESADSLLDQCKFDEATRLLEDLAKNSLDSDIAEGARARMDEIKMGRMFKEGVDAFKAENFDLALMKLKAVADSQIDNRWASRAWQIVKTIPAAKLYTQALKDVADGKNYEAMQKLQKVMALEDAGGYADMAKEKLEEIRKNWRKKVG
jgi:hypothetical protein